MKNAIRKFREKLGTISAIEPQKKRDDQDYSKIINLEFSKNEQLKLGKISIFSRLIPFKLNKRTDILDKFSALKYQSDLPSIAEFVDFHHNIFLTKKDNKSFFTTDAATLEIAKNILK